MAQSDTPAPSRNAPESHQEAGGSSADHWYRNGVPLRRLKGRPLDGLARQLRWLLIARSILLACTAVLALLVLLSNRDGPSPSAIVSLLQVAVAGLVASGVYLAIGASGRVSLAIQAYLHLAGDLLLVTALVYSTGGALSSFSMLYLLVIAAAATILKRRAGITIAEVAWLLYAATVLSLYFGWPASPTGDEGVAFVSVGRLAYELFIHLVGFYGVAYLTSLLSNQAARAQQELAVATDDLENLEIFHSDVVQSMSSGLLLLDLEDNVVNINRSGRAILALEGEVAGLQLNELGFLDEDHWQQLLVEAEGGRIRDEVVLDTAGDPRTVGFSVGLIHDADDRLKGRSVVFQDLTDWRRLQTELDVKERMAAVGELAAGLAHEIGNPLAAISGSVQMLQSSDDTDSADSKLLTIVLKESQRLDRTIKGFLQFAKPHEKRVRQFDICLLINEHLELLANSEEVQQAHKLSAELEHDSFDLVADRDQISQVLWNLARNALRAMPEGGLLKISGFVKANDAVNDTVRRAVEDPTPERWYCLQFSDNGIGMSETQRHGLFHPFRSHQGGTGIGMAIVYRIIQAHSGRIEIESEEGVGTTIEIRLPA